MYIYSGGLFVLLAVIEDVKWRVGLFSAMYVATNCVNLEGGQKLFTLLGDRL